MCIDSVILFWSWQKRAFFRSFRHCDFEAQTRMLEFFFSSRLKGSKLPGTYKRVPCRLNISQFMYVSGAKLIILIHEEGREKI